MPSNAERSQQHSPQFSKDHALESFRYGPRLLSGILRQLPKRMWNYKPSAAVWSVHEIVVHLADVEAAEYLTCRAIVVESVVASANNQAPKIASEPARPAATHAANVGWLPPDISKWATPLGYFYQSPRQALDIIKTLRLATYNLLLSLPGSVWLMSSPAHAAEGKVNLQNWLTTQEHYIPAQIEQMNGLYTSWVKAHRRNASARKPRRTFAPVSAEAESQVGDRQVFAGGQKHVLRGA